MAFTRSVRAFLLAAALVIPLAAVAVSLAHADPVAVLAAVQGKVEVVPAATKKAVRAAFGRPLERGDRISVGTGGAATVFFSDGNVVELAEKSTITVGGRAEARTAPAAGLPGEVYTQVSKFVTAGSRRTGLVALSEMRGPDDGAPVIVAPRRSTVLDVRPTLRWRAVTGAKTYRLTFAAAGGDEMFVRSTPTIELDWPSDVASLQAGNAYHWTVDALDGSKLLRSESVDFRIATDEQAVSVRANVARIQESAGGGDSAAARYLVGSYLAGLGLYQDAAAHFDALCRLSPESPGPHEALGNVYTRVGLMDLAAAEYQQALALARE
jgi:hypothetical protein